MSGAFLLQILVVSKTSKAKAKSKNVKIIIAINL